MHPQLHEHKHDECVEVIRKLNECHKQSFWARLTGQCNPVKDELNACLTREFNAKRKANAKSAKERRERVEAKWKEIQENQ
ncbi:MAG: cytochrome c oxidase biogenesis protein Cmc1-like protein [Piptocephalis tieghemiana]|nr:MAG: cytochrome c oxidase biogenesis protein Cmc1-like protein [Piptocephalis tieghemiana]